jgi:hypothetical protein
VTVLSTDGYLMVLYGGIVRIFIPVDKLCVCKVDVAQIAKACHVTKNAQTSLAELSALVLHHHMQ